MVLPVDDVFWNATILHTAGVTQPSQSALSKQSVHTGKTSTRQDISVGYFVLPGYSQDTADASQVECVEPSLLPGSVIFFSTLVPGSGNFQLSRLAGLGYALGLGFWVVFTIIVSLTLTLTLITTLTVILP